MKKKKKPSRRHRDFITTKPGLTPILQKSYSKKRISDKVCLYKQVKSKICDIQFDNKHKINNPCHVLKHTFFVV